jgi:signal transduction histidine kinase
MNAEKRRKRGQQGEDETTPARQQVRDVVEGTFVVVLMTVVTLFALFGEDLVFWFTDKSADLIF